MKRIREIDGKEAVVQIVEKRIPFHHITVDVFGCIDIIWIHGSKIMGIQACAGSGHAAHLRKALAEPRLKRWLNADALFEIWSWSKGGPRGKRKTWSVRVQQLCWDSDKAKIVVMPAEKPSSIR
jgi:hypothetical protein